MMCGSELVSFLLRVKMVISLQWLLVGNFEICKNLSQNSYLLVKEKAKVDFSCKNMY